MQSVEEGRVLNRAERWGERTEQSRALMRERSEQSSAEHVKVLHKVMR
jgi:hypothetical protein